MLAATRLAMNLASGQKKPVHIGLPEKAPIACAAVDPSGFCR